MFEGYVRDTFYDEMLCDDNQPRPPYRRYYELLSRFPKEIFAARHDAAKQLFLRQGITYTMYDNALGVERTLPFDLVPRIIPSAEWHHIERGLIQRVTALNEFLKDIYSTQYIIRDHIISRQTVYASPDFQLEMMNVPVPKGIHTVLSGIDLIRNEQGGYQVLEDNLRIPSGISYAYKNRNMMKRVFAEAFSSYHVAPLEPFMKKLGDTFAYLSPRQIPQPTVVLLTPGRFNSAFFDHSFLAQSMGIELVEGSDLIVINQIVYMRTTSGLRQVDVIYRRLDDGYLDPLSFNLDSLIGVPGLFDAYRAGNVAIANPWGNGVADDKLIYSYVPDFIRYYLNEDPILPNVITYRLTKDNERQHVIENIEDMVIKPTNASGGAGLFFGYAATRAECEDMQRIIQKEPRNFIAQPLISLSRHPTWMDGDFEPCPIDLRPFVAFGETLHVLPGGLTRVALERGSCVVNSSRGGGAKDTWIVVGEGEPTC
ncbi:hypothetical protein MM817_00605 [Acidibacillus sp. S0AB]|uniref:Circularly permuted ATP-grasp type 2 domain-containing protein n=2 Tax=Sulfoacidibacillus ferrooxidans TaxID=2005001 RepID=A0A9X1V6D8_9BACL|nr:hypothetical protein [Sulfoacidibacillus ferrooxidans]